MRAILINPKDKTITEVDYNGDYKHINQLIDAELFDCVVMDNDGNTIFTDDEGLVNGTASRVGMFRVEGDNPAYLAGKGLILGTNGEGNSVATTLPLDWVRERIAFGVMRIPLFTREVLFESYDGHSWRVE